MTTYNLPGTFARKKEFIDYCRNIAQKEWNDELHNQGFAREQTNLSYDDIMDAAKMSSTATWSLSKRAIFRIEEYWEINVAVYDRKLRTKFFVWIHVPNEKLNEKVFNQFGVTVRAF